MYLRGEEKTPEVLNPERDLQRKLYLAGYAGIAWPQEYGGQGLSPAHESVFAELARDYQMPDLGIAGGTTFSVCGPTMLAHASPAFLKRHVPKMLAGERLVVQLFSDPEAGSDLAGIRTRARRTERGWVLSGSKIWSSGAYYSDYGMCLARTDWDAPKHRGLTWFAVPLDAKGVTIQRIKQINGDAEFCQEFLDDVELSDDDVIGEVNDGWRIAQTMLMFERGGGHDLGSQGDSHRPLAADLVALASEVGNTQDPLVRQLIAKGHVEDFARDQLLGRLVAQMQADPATAAHRAAYAKLAAGLHDPARAAIALEIGGVAAVTWDQSPSPSADAALAYLNGRFMSIAGGTNEMQRNTIGERVLGLPAEPSFDRKKPFSEVVREARSWSGRVS
jgi:alkylation response protein AidB-like acyl-CoA dehydrogenase